MGKNQIWSPLETPDELKSEITFTKGTRLVDIRGKEYLDVNSGLWNTPFGYSDENILSEVKKQLDEVAYVNPCEFTTHAAKELADNIVELLDADMDKILYTCSGSECADLAIKIIRKYSSLGGNPERNFIAVIKHSYHGSYYGAMSISDYCGELRKGYAPLLQNIVEISLPFSEVIDIDTGKAMKQLEEELELYGKRLGGIIIEPVLGSAGVIQLPDWYIEKIVRFAKEKDILIAFDEVATGFGRTGDLFRFKHYRINPDIVMMSKAINNGILPLGAVAVSKKIVNRFRENKEMLFHLSTQNANALACVAGKATMQKFFSENNCLNNIKDLADKILVVLNELKRRYVQISNIRSCGMMFAIEMRDNSGNQLNEEAIIRTVRLLKKNGLLVEWSYIKDVSSCIVIMPMYIMNGDEINMMKDIFEKTFDKLLYC